MHNETEKNLEVLHALTIPSIRDLDLDLLSAMVQRPVTAVELLQYLSERLQLEETTGTPALFHNSVDAVLPDTQA